MNATVIFLPKANSPLSVELPSAKIVLFALTLSPTLTIGFWWKQILELANSKLETLYSSSPSLVSTIIFLASTYLTTPLLFAIISTPESLAAIYSTPVPT